MENLALEISKVLNITVEGAIEMMPVIKGQFLAYSVIDIVETFAVNFTFFAAITLITSCVVYYMHKDSIGDDSHYYKNEEEIAIYSKKVMKQALAVLILFIVIAIVASNMKYIVAPDYSLIKEFVLK